VQEIFSSPYPSKPTVGPKEFPVQWVTGLVPGVKLLELGDDHPVFPSPKLKMGRFIPLPPLCVSTGRVIFTLNKTCFKERHASNNVTGWNRSVVKFIVWMTVAGRINSFTVLIKN
jgi:hypothetical protein